MHREPLSSTSVAHCESQCRETTGPGMPCAPRARRPEAVGVRLAPPRVPPRVQPGPHAAGAAVVFSSSDLPFDAEAPGQVRRPRPAQAVGPLGARRPEAPDGFRKSERPQREGGHGACLRPHSGTGVSLSLLWFEGLPDS
ncbi:hypothetical protein H8959_001807 [Pygathrix nigripes]